MQWGSVGYELYNARRGCQREDFVGANAEVALAGGSLGFQEAAYLIEDLLHYRVLSKIIAATLELLIISLYSLFAFKTTY